MTSSSSNGNGFNVSRLTALADLPELLSVDEVCTWAGIGRSCAYDLIRRGELASIRFGRSVRIPKVALAELVQAAQ